MLPPGWEAREDGAGRKFYVDHNTQSTSWTPPTTSESDERLAQRLQMELDANSISPLSTQAIDDKAFARKLQSKEELEQPAVRNSVLKHFQRHENYSDLEGPNSRPPPADFEGYLRMRKELKGLGWRQVCGSTLAVFPDPKQSAAELRVEVKGASLHESLSQGKLRSMKNEIFRWKITVADSSISVSDSIIDGGKTGRGEIEFAAADEMERAAWLGWRVQCLSSSHRLRWPNRCIVAGAIVPPSAELVSSAFKPLLSQPPSPERAQALKALSKVLADKNSPIPCDTLVRSLSSSGVLALVAECLQKAPGQESAARCTYFAARADEHAARILLANSAEKLLLPLLTSPDDGLQQWAAAAMAPVLMGDPLGATSAIVSKGGVFTIVALLSSVSTDVRSHALATLVALCSAAMNAAWPKTSLGDSNARTMLNMLLEMANDAGVCETLIPLLSTQQEHIATAALECIVALHFASSKFRSCFRRALAGNRKLAGDLVSACTDRRFVHYVLRVLADACYCVDEETGVENSDEASAAADAASVLFTVGGLGVAVGALTDMTESNSDSTFSSLLEAAARIAADARGSDASFHSQRDDGTRIIASIVAHVPGAIDRSDFEDSAHLLSALVSTVAFELAPSLEIQEGRPQTTAALLALSLCLSARARQQDAALAIEAAQIGLLELIGTRGFFDVSLVRNLKRAPIRGFIAAQGAMLLHSSIRACWCDFNNGPQVVLALAAPPGGRSLSRLCQLLDALAQNGLVFSTDSLTDVASALVTAIMLALGSLCGATRPFGQVAHASEDVSKRDISLSLGSCVTIATSLSHESFALEKIERRRAAARLLAALLRDDNPVGRANESLDMIASALVHAGLLGIVARCLDDNDPIVRTTALDAFVVLSAYAPTQDRDTAVGGIALGTALARGLVASDASAQHTAIGGITPEIVRLRIKVAVEKAVGALYSACRHGGVVASDAISTSADCQNALVSLARLSSSIVCEFALRCAGMCLSTVITIAIDSECRASELAKVGACDVAATALVDMVHRDPRDNRAEELLRIAMGVVRIFATYTELRRQLANSNVPILHALFLEISRVRDHTSLRLGKVALAVLLSFAQPRDVIAHPEIANRLAAAANCAKAVPTLTHVLKGGWLTHCTDAADNDIIVTSARQIMTAIANAKLPVRSKCLEPQSGNIAKIRFVSSIDIVGGDIKSRFCERYTARLRRLHADGMQNAVEQSTVLGGADPAALVSLIATEVSSDDPTEVSAHATAVDRACATLRVLLVTDASGCAATQIIQGGAFVQLLARAPKSPAVADCLEVLCNVGELHRPLLLSKPTPEITIRFVDTVIDMLCTASHSLSQADSDLNIVWASLHILHTICSDSDAAFMLAVAIALRGHLSLAVARLTTIVTAEVVVGARTWQGSNVTLPATLTLVSILAPRIQDVAIGLSDIHNFLHLSTNKRQKLFERLPVRSLMERLAIDKPALFNCTPASRRMDTNSLVALLDDAASAAAARTVSILLRVLLGPVTGGFRASLRGVIAAIIVQRPTIIRYIQVATAVEPAIQLVFDNPSVETSRADATLGLELLSIMVDTKGESVAHPILVHENFFSCLSTHILRVTTTSCRGELFVLAALDLIANLTNLGRDTCVRVASRRDLLGALVILVECPTPEISHMRVVEKALLILANISAGGPALRDVVAQVHGILETAIKAINLKMVVQPQATKLQISAARLAAALIRARGVTHLTSNTAELLVAEVGDAFSSIIKSYGSCGVITPLYYLIGVLDALSYHAEGAEALQSSGPVSVLTALLEMTLQRFPDIAEVRPIVHF